MLSSSSLADQDVKLRHRNTLTNSSTTTSLDSDTCKHEHSIYGRETFHTEEKSPIKEQLIEDDSCSGKPRHLVFISNSSPSADVNALSYMEHADSQESSDESHSNQVTTIGNSMEYRKKSGGHAMRSNDLQRQTSTTAAGATISRNNTWTWSWCINLLLEIAIRVLLCYGTVKFERTIAFKRIIHPEEVWLYKNPISKDYVPASTALFWIIVAPLVLIFTNFLLSRDRKDFKHATYAFTLAVAMNGFLTSLLKVSIGRPRPDFFYRCFPDGVMGESFDLCTGDPKVIEEGRKSFPSGHSSMTFAAFGFMSYFLASKLHVFNERGRGQSWRLCVSLVPLCVALEVAVSRTCDYHHHWQDVLVGSLLGIFVSYLCYRQYFPSIFAKNCHRAYSSSSKISPSQTKCFVGSARNATGAGDTDENQPLIIAEKQNKWI